MSLLSIVNILTCKSESIGCGFFVSPKGYILTCVHVLHEAGYTLLGNEINYKLTDNEKIYKAIWVAKDEKEDIALLLSQSEKKDFPYIPLCDHNCLEVEAEVYGFPIRSKNYLDTTVYLRSENKKTKKIHLEKADSVTEGFSGTPLLYQNIALGMVVSIPDDPNGRMKKDAHAISVENIWNSELTGIDKSKNYIEEICIEKLKYCNSKKKIDRENEEKRNDKGKNKNEKRQKNPICSYRTLKELYDNQIQWLFNESILCVGNERRKQYQVLHMNKDEAKLFVEPTICEVCRDKYLSFEQLKEKVYKMSKGKVLVVYGEEGVGKSTLLKRLFIQKKSKNDCYMWIPATVLRNTNQNRLKKEKRILSALLKGEWKPKKKIYVFIDAIDEAFNEEYLKQLNSTVQKCKNRGLITIVACRKEFYLKNIEKSKDNEINKWGQEFHLEKWNLNQAKQYIKKYLIKNEVYQKFEKEYINNPLYIEFLCNPFKCTLLLYLFENGEKEIVQLKNTYHLYSCFYELYLKKELEREDNKCIKKEDVYLVHYFIAEKLYSNRNSLVDLYKKGVTPNKILRLCDYPVVQSLLKLDNTTGNNSYIVAGFSLNESFVEFLLIHRLINYGLQGAKELARCSRIVYRYFQCRFWEMGLDELTIEELNVLKNNLEEIYLSSSTATEKNFALRFLGRMPRNIVVNSKLISCIYWEESDLQLKINVATIIMDHDLDDQVEEHYIKSLLNQSSEINEKLRAWARYYFGDSKINDPEYGIDEGGEWTNIRKKRLRRLGDISDSVLNIRTLDLIQLLIFYRSRGWQDIKGEDYKIIRNCMNNITKEKISSNKWKLINLLLSIYETEVPQYMLEK